MAEYDLVIRNGLIIDGSGDEPFIGDVAVKDCSIVATGDSTAILNNGLYIDIE